MADTTAIPSQASTADAPDMTHPGPVPLVPDASRGTRVPPRRPTGPLPDAVAIHSVAVPETAPPYDDAAPGCGRPRPAPSIRSVTDRAGTAHPGQAQIPLAQPRPAPGAQPSQVPGGTWPSRFAQVLTETLAGSRPPGQIVPWTTDQARRRISQLGPLLATAQRPRIRRVIACSPAGGVLEMTVVVGFGDRVRAVAVRLERVPPTALRAPASQDQWRCTAVEAA